MSEESLPCIVCRGRLFNVCRDSENQPSEGTAFMTYGHYGSTVFDPMDGTALEINICDSCLTQAGHDGVVAWERRYKPITCHGVIVGREHVVRPNVTWNPDTEEREPTSEDVLDLDVEEVGQPNLSRRVEWVPDWREIVASIRQSAELDQEPS